MNFEFRILNNKKQGFTLIEMMVFIFIFTIICMTFYKVFTTGTKAMGSVRSRLGALELANERIEIIHNLDYEKIGTDHGIPTGQLLQDETVTRSGKTYYVHTTVIAIDDSFDGTAALGTDTNPADYKQVRVQVYWENNNPASSVTLNSNISPPGIESIYTGGILSLHVTDNSGVGIPQARVIITNNTVSPTVNLDVTTDNSGNLFLPQAPPANQTYAISVSKSGYFSVQTYAPYPTSTVAPVDIHASVAASSINQKTIVTDKVSALNIYTKTPLGDIVPNIDFSLAGGRKIADTVAPTLNAPQPVWAFSQDPLSSTPTGGKSFSDMSSGSYTFTYKSTAGNSAYTFLHLDKASNAVDTFVVSPGATLDLTAVVADNNKDSLLATVLDNADSAPLLGATVELKNSDASYDVTLTTDKFGQVYFPDSSAALVAGDYVMNISLTGYTSIANKTVHVDKLTKETINLTAS